MFPSWTIPAFAVAGAVCALVPVVIHLVNRRRFRVVEWAAMDFLQQAVRGRRRVLRLRDVLLLVLRVAAVLLFGLALARPYWTTGIARFDRSGPVHAVLLIDNSLSMAYETRGVSSLDRAKLRARALVERLPSGSRVSVVPLCGMAGGYPARPQASRTDASRLIERISVVDRSLDLAMVAAAATVAARAVPDMPSRVFCFTDQQLATWRAHRSPQAFRRFPEMQFISVAPQEAENTWISDFSLQDEIADVETASTFVVRVSRQGNTARNSVPVTLYVDGQGVASQSVSFPPGAGTQEIVFRHALGRARRVAGGCAFVDASVSIPPDQLTLDDERHLIVPLVSGLPIVFVDQYGEQGEDVWQGRHGETQHLRRLLVPVSHGPGNGQELIEIRHLTIDQLDDRLLHDVRLVVIAGVAEPGSCVPVLREFIEQGGQLLIAAGADFDPVAWTAEAWQGGAGILPAPLEAGFSGRRPEEASDGLKPFFLSYPSMAQHPYFRWAGVSDEELADLYAEPFFFRAARVDVSERVIQELEKLTETTSPQVLARFDTGDPFIVQRHIGRGSVCFVASSLGSDWNTLPKTNAFLIFDRMVRSMLRSTVPQRNLRPAERITIAVPDQGPRAAYLLDRPGDQSDPEYLDTGFLSAHTRGITISDALERGIYRVTADPSMGTASSTLPDDIMIAVGAPAEETYSESDLTTLTDAQFREYVAEAPLRWIGRDKTISFAGLHVRGEQGWSYLAMLVLVCLLAEMGICRVMSDE